VADATENYWCAGDAAVVASRIFDVIDDPELGPIVFEPFLASPPEEAPADPGPPASGG
jgi:hypothetical protein